MSREKRQHIRHVPANTPALSPVTLYAQSTNGTDQGTEEVGQF